jgi:glycerol uptake facilitator-like aquaporin
VTPTLARRAIVELVGSAALAAIVVGSGIAATRLSDDVGIQLLINALATVFGLFVLVSVLGPISGAQLNPAVTLADATLGLRAWRDVVFYVPTQIAGCVLGAILANLMFGMSAVSVSATARATPGHLLAEVVATAGLVFAIFSLVRLDRAAQIPGVVAAFIGAAYFFTSSTSFANPAITVGRMFSDSFAGIAPSSAPWFIAAQLVGCALGLAAVRTLSPRPA